MKKTSLDYLNNEFPYGIYSKGKIELEEGIVIGDIASEGKVKIEKDFKLEGKESSIYVAEENIRASDFGNYRDRQKTLIDTKKREYNLVEFPDKVDFPKESINALNIDNIEIKSNVNIISKDPEIDIGDNEYELELIIDESVVGDIYIDINNSNMDKYEELELEIKFKDNIKISGNVYIDMNLNSNSKETEMEIELGMNTSIEGNIYVDINSNNGDSKETELEIELERGANIEGDIYVNIKSENEYEKTKFEMELDEDSKMTGNIYTNVKKLEIGGSDSDKVYGVINGLIYAPRSKIELENGIKINGGVVGNNVEVEDKNTIITYDSKYI